jgi:hypothetical protein
MEVGILRGVYTNSLAKVGDIGQRVVRVLNNFYFGPYPSSLSHARNTEIHTLRGLIDICHSPCKCDRGVIANE